MKTIGYYLFKLTKLHQFAPYSKYACLESFKAILPPRFQSAISYFAIKNDTLHIALSHPGFKLEIDNNRDLLKSLLNDISKHKSECDFSNIKHINTFIANFHTMQNKQEKEITIPKYNEQASGNFEVDENVDNDLQKIFSDIKKAIRCNQS